MVLTHFRPDVGQDRSVRIFGQRPFEDSVGSPVILNPKEVARQLMHFADMGARYPANRDLYDAKGWTIHKAIDEDGNVFIGAYATWVPQR
ncbi:MAG TPA: hypothetical protein VIJ29_04160 [Candidatus Paceibacterota bacterium]